MVQAVLAIEDKRFYDHPGVDIFRSSKAIFTNLAGEKPYLEGASTITQQLVRNVFLSSIIANPLEKSMRRKLTEQFMALVLERRASKDEILELYLNEVYLGQRGSFAIHGVAEAARLFFGKDVMNVSLAEGGHDRRRHPVAAGPARRSAGPRIARAIAATSCCRPWRTAGFISTEACSGGGRRAAGDRRAGARGGGAVLRRPGRSRPVRAVSRSGAPARSRSTSTRRSICNLQRFAQDAVREGLTSVDQLLGKRRQKLPPAQAVARSRWIREPATCSRWWAGARTTSRSSTAPSDRARQPGSAFKPFVYLAAFERAAAEGRTDLTPASLVVDEPTTFLYEDKDYTPSNYEDEYDGEITLRRALAHVAERRHRQGRRADRVRSGGEPLEARRRQRAAASRIRRLRSASSR